jgi:uncharacterized protein YjiS (DUF1127 family)
MIAVSDILPSVLNEMGIPVETIEESLHREGDCNGATCKFCLEWEAQKERRRELHALRDQLFRQLDDIESELWPKSE